MVHKFNANHLLFLLHCFCNDLYSIQGLNTEDHRVWCEAQLY